MALLSVLLVLSAFRCTATCIVSETATSAHPGSATVPPCHRHHAPVKDSRKQVPCQDHPGLLAYSVDQPSAPIDPRIDLPAVYEPTPLLSHESWNFAAVAALHSPPLPRPESLASIVLRI